MLDIRNNIYIIDKNKRGQVAIFNKVIKHLLKNNKEVKLALIDYENKYYKRRFGNEHFLLPIAINKEEATAMLDKIKKIQNDRLSLIKNCNAKNIEQYNRENVDKITYIFLFVYELNDIFTYEQVDKLLSLVNLSKSTGIFIFIGTSFIDKNTTLCDKIKANFLDRICFTVDSKEESKLAIDKYGAESLDRGTIMFNK